MVQSSAGGRIGIVCTHHCTPKDRHHDEPAAGELVRDAVETFEHWQRRLRALRGLLDGRTPRERRRNSLIAARCRRQRADGKNGADEGRVHVHARRNVNGKENVVPWSTMLVTFRSDP